MQQLPAHKERPLEWLPATFVKQSSPGWTRTSDQGIMSQRVAPENLEENTHFQGGAAVGAKNATIDPDLQSIIERWSDLSEAVKDDLLAMVKAADEAQ